MVELYVSNKASVLSFTSSTESVNASYVLTNPNIAVPPSIAHPIGFVTNHVPNAFIFAHIDAVSKSKEIVAPAFTPVIPNVPAITPASLADKVPLATASLILAAVTLIVAFSSNSFCVIKPELISSASASALLFSSFANFSDN